MFALGFLLHAPGPMTMAQTVEKPSKTVAAFYELISGPWAQITRNANLSIAKDQITIAALQCRSARHIDTSSASTITSISKSVSQKYSKVIIYQKLKTGLNRVDLATRSAILFPKVRTGKIRGGKLGFEISNKRGNITIAFAKLKQGNRSVPVMIEGKALFLKCQVKQ